MIASVVQIEKSASHLVERDVEDFLDHHTRRLSHKVRLRAGRLIDLIPSRLRDRAGSARGTSKKRRNAMPKMTDSRRKKIQAKQRQRDAEQKRERKAARRTQKGAKGAAGTASL